MKLCWISMERLQAFLHINLTDQNSFSLKMMQRLPLQLHHRLSMRQIMQHCCARCLDVHYHMLVGARMEYFYINTEKV